MLADTEKLVHGIPLVVLCYGRTDAHRRDGRTTTGYSILCVIGQRCAANRDAGLTAGLSNYYGAIVGTRAGQYARNVRFSAPGRCGLIFAGGQIVERVNSACVKSQQIRDAFSSFHKASARGEQDDQNRTSKSRGLEAENPETRRSVLAKG